MTRAPVAFLAIAGVVSIEACTCGGADVFDREASVIENALIAPVGTQLVDRGVGSRETLQVVRSWQLRAPGAWTQYADGLESAMPPSYRCSRAAVAMLCSRALPGDELRLRVESSMDAKGLALRAELLGGPD